MKRFRFRLEKILNLRRYREREWEQKLAVISGICLELENRIKMLHVEKERVIANYGSGSDISSMVSRDLYLFRLDRGMEELGEELQKKRKELERVREEYLRVSGERKVLEKLKERQEKNYYKRERLEEIKVIDDLNNAKANRKTG